LSSIYFSPSFGMQLLLNIHQTSRISDDAYWMFSLKIPRSRRSIFSQASLIVYRWHRYRPPYTPASLHLPQSLEDLFRNLSVLSGVPAAEFGPTTGWKYLPKTLIFFGYLTSPFTHSFNCVLIYGMNHIKRYKELTSIGLP